LQVYFLFSIFQIPDYYEASLQIQTVLIIAVISVGAIFIWMIFKVAKTNLLKIKTGKEALIGSVGLAVNDLKPNGEIRVMGEFWRAKVKGMWINKGEKVEVVDMEGMSLVVKPVKEKFNSLT
jgi:membrane-bound serine protease (ClpP class)